MSEWSVRNPNQGAQRLADSLLWATGGCSAMLLIPASQGDSSDAAQLGIAEPSFQPLLLSPVVFRRTRPTTTANEEKKYELLVSASVVTEQVTLLNLQSADALFALAAGVTVSGLSLLIESWSCSVSLGLPLLYRLLLQAAQTPSTVMTSEEV